jgi:2-polyprenyl-6-methoxyphenol hydroxylase-like FAD-dependent oxidoreductase
VIEKTGPNADPGYMLGLMPLVAPTIRDLDLKAPYRERSVGVNRYRLRDRHGATIREYPFDSLMAEFGDYRGISRGELIEVLTDGGATVTFDATVAAIAQDGDALRATVAHESGGTEAGFDLAIAADGLHSGTRALVLREDQYAPFDTGWGGWVAWIEPDAPTTDLYEEVWGPGYFIGVYPVRDRVGVFVGGDRKATGAGAESFVRGVREHLTTVDDRIGRALDAVAADPDPYYWRFADGRADMWSVGRVGLLGDAASGFLPTAGIGAGMAMESAGVLARKLAGAEAAEVPRVLAAFEAAQRPRVDAAQDNSRQLARLAFRDSVAIAAVRDLAMRFFTLRMALGPIRKLLETAPAA